MLRDSTGVPVVDAALNYVQATAEVQAVPTAISKVQPFFIASIVLGLIGAVLGFTAFIGTRRKPA